MATKTRQDVLNDIAKNVSSVKGAKLIAEAFGVKTYDVVCMVTVNEEGNKNQVTQRMYVENEGTEKEEAYLGGVTRKNFTAPEQPEKSDSQLKSALSKIKLLDPNAKYVGMDTSPTVTVVKLQVNGVVKAYSLLDGELIELDAA